MQPPCFYKRKLVVLKVACHVFRANMTAGPVVFIRLKQQMYCTNCKLASFAQVEMDI